MKLFTTSQGKDEIQSSARVVDGTLILSLPDATSPVVWRWDLSDVKASAIEIREDGAVHKLILKTPLGDVQDVAKFDNKQTALTALLKVSKAMEMAHGQIRPKEMVATGSPVASFQAPRLAPSPLINPNAQEDGNIAGTVLMGVGGLIVLGMLFLWLGSIQPKQLNKNPSSGSATSTASPSSSASDADTGVPLSADDFLNGL